MQENLTFKKKMYNTVLGVLDKHLLEWETNVGLKEDVDLIREKVLIIDNKETFDKRTLGTTAGKNQKFDLMCEGAFTICNSGGNYGSKIGDEKIRIDFDYSLSDIRKGHEQTSYDLCVAISEAATPFETILTTSYNLPIGFLDEQTVRNEAFFVLIDAPGKIIEQGKSNKEGMIVEYHDIDLILNQRVDKTIKSYKKNSPTLVLEYKNARIIGNRHHPPKPFVDPSKPVDPITPAE